MRFAHLFNIKIHWEKIVNQFFNYWNIDLIQWFLAEQNPDILVLQEISNQEVAEELAKRFWYKHVYTNSSYKYAPLICILSKFSLESQQIFSWDHADFFMYSHQDFNFIPVHLHAFSSLARYAQCKELSEIPYKKDCFIIWDFNLWQVWARYLYTSDKRAVEQLKLQFDEILQNKSSTTSWICMDKVFLSHWSTMKISADIEKIKWKYMDHFPLIFNFTI